jgi:flagellar biosynthetic protein FlhB
MSASSAEKNFDATPARKQKAKRDGNVARSSELSGIAALAGATLGTFAVIPLIGAATVDALRACATSRDPLQLPPQLVMAISMSLLPAVGAALGAIGAGLLQAGGLRLAAPKWQLTRLDPVAGLKRMVGGEAIIGALRAIVAFVIVTLALVPLGIEMLGRATTVTGPAAFALLALDGAQRACWAALAVGAVFAVADYALVRRRWLRELKMTFEEIRRDQKENDGDPNARSRRKALHRSLVRGSITRIKEASFVVVNPTHIAIAIRYAPPTVAVPEIIVRAADEGAARVRALAHEHAIPIIENVALARELYALGEAGRAIPSQTFVAVARVIAALLREGVLT